jgi:2-polyprenyl-3-methyl-5-hydroxy-6-metoxy-1,4-benzoquinol methylase
MAKVYQQEDPSIYPLSTALLDELKRQMPFLHRAVFAGKPTMAQRLGELEQICLRLQKIRPENSDWIAGAVKAYVMLSMEFSVLQKKLEKTGHYLLSSEKEAYDKVYGNSEVFDSYYLDGLLLSEALWPNHFQLNHLYRESFLPMIDETMQVVEGGVGTGYHLKQLLEKVVGVNYLGLDVSPYAIDFCRLFSGISESDTQAFRLCNIGDKSVTQSLQADAIILGEILEHVENPDAMLKQMRNIVKPGTPMFMTTVVFAANIDHIYMFENAEEIRELISICGWSTVEELVLPIYPQDQPDMNRRPMNYGAILVAN